MLYSIVKLLKKSTLFLKTPRSYFTYMYSILVLCLYFSYLDLRCSVCFEGVDAGDGFLTDWLATKYFKKTTFKLPDG